MLREYFELPRSIHILCLGSFVNRAGSFVLIFLTIYISEQLGYSQTFAAWCMGAFGFGSMIAALIGGQLADTIGRKAVMVASLFLGALLLIVLTFATSAWAVLLTIATYGMVAESFRPACSAMIGDLTRPDQRASAFGLYYIAINLGFACGPPIGGVIADHSYTLLFWADATTMAFFGVVLIAFISETVMVRDQSGESKDSVASVSINDAIQRIIFDRPFMMFCLASVLIGMAFCQLIATLPIFIKSVGYTNQQFGFLMAINGFLIFLCQLPLTHFLNRFSPMSSMVFGSVLMGIGIVIYCLPTTTFLLIVAVVIWTIGEMIQAPFKNTVVTEMAPLELRARYLGTLGMCFSLSWMIGAPLGGEVLHRFGPTILWTGTCGLAVLSAVFYVLTEKLRRQENSLADVTRQA